MISTSGSGQMVPIPMNEFMQQNFKAVGMQIDFDVVEWGTMLVACAAIRKRRRRMATRASTSA